MAISTILIRWLTAGLLLGSSLSLTAQEKPSYCDRLPVSYEKGATVSSRPSLPKFGTTPIKEYKIQVAILRQTSPEDYPFHEKLIARYRPCEQVWVIESREIFKDRRAADRLKEELVDLGYRGAYLVELIGYQ